MEKGAPTGVLAYRGKTPVGWLSLGPRENFARLERSPVLKPVADKTVWSIICFLAPLEQRGQGAAKALLEGAMKCAKKEAAALLEAYPVDRAKRSRENETWSAQNRSTTKLASRKSPAANRNSRWCGRKRVKRAKLGPGESACQPASDSAACNPALSCPPIASPPFQRALHRPRGRQTY